MALKKPTGLSTLSVHGGRDADNRDLALPLFTSVVGVFDSLKESVDTFQGKRSGFIYARYGHRTGEAVESRVAALEDAEAGALFSSGMAAIGLCVLAFCRAGDHLLASNEQYGGVPEFLKEIAATHGIQVEFVSLEGLGNLQPRVRENTRMVLLESPTNPLINLVDLEQLFAGLGNPRPLVALDSTLASPIGQDSLGAGCDLVIHSGTKYLGGHDDLTAGVVLGKQSLIDTVRNQRRIFGANADPQVAWLLERGMKTLSVRWDRQCENAGLLAAKLEAHPSVSRVFYPGLPSHPHHELAKRQMPSFGAMLAFEVEGGLTAAEKVFDRVDLVARAPSLGGVESMMLHPTTSSHRTLTPEERDEVGIRDGLLRMSVGIEDAEDLWKDLEQALGS